MMVEHSSKALGRSTRARHAGMAHERGTRAEAQGRIEGIRIRESDRAKQLEGIIEARHVVAKRGNEHRELLQWGEDAPVLLRSRGSASVFAGVVRKRRRYPGRKHARF